MVLLVIGLVVSIGFERSEVSGHCLKTSISAYYYTPVHNYFVVALFGVGVSLFCLRGHTEIEDGLLNLAGMCAPIVALVPTPAPARGSCASVPRSLEHQGANIDNNITTLIVVGVLAGLILAGLAVVKRVRADGRLVGAWPPVVACVMYVLAAVVWIILMLGFWVMDDDVFAENAHDAAAIAMFACIFFVVLLNASGYKRKKTKLSPLNPYVGVYLAMVASVAIAVVARQSGWDYWVIFIEFALIMLFAVFWAIQTIELWDDGLR
ncbi:MAG: hypothetical protein M3401_12265 [Actinomycetota bacterium]|nr:hypothetical protein [Actinomycetota bacterium]